MPLYEARGFNTRYTLNSSQKQEALRAIYGLKPPETMTNPQLSRDDIERMRLLVSQHDSQNRVGIKEFDLNNPPREQYFHQEFPRLVYHHSKRKHQLAHNEEDLAAALEAGWQKEPFPSEVAAPDLDADEQAEIAKLNAIAKKKRS